MIARDVMTASPVVVAPETSVGEAGDLMRENGFRHLPVVQGGALVGMVSDRDLGYLDVGRLLLDEGVEALKRQLAMPVLKVMTSDVITVEADADLGEIVSLMIEHRVGAIPVVRAGSRVVVGIVSYVDVLRAVEDLLEGD